MRNASSLSAMRGTAPKSSDACSTVTSSASAMDMPPYFTSSVSRLYRRPLQASQVDEDVGQVKCISTRDIAVALVQASQRPPLSVEGEAARSVATGPSVRQSGVQVAQEGEDAGVCGWIGPRRAPDWGLVDGDDLVDVVETLHPIALADGRRRVVELRARRGQKCVDHQAGLAAPTDAGKAREKAHWDLGRHVSQELCARAPSTRTLCLVRVFLLFGMGSRRFPFSHGPVKDFGFAISSAGVPCATISPPCTPAPGPMSMTWSAERMASRSCSTTMTVLPRSRTNRICASMRRALSRACSPTLGSSST